MDEAADRLKLENAAYPRSEANSVKHCVALFHPEGPSSMRRCLPVLLLLATVPCLQAAQPAAPSVTPVASSTSGRKAKGTASLPKLGHRNWILIVDSPSPLQSSPGVETVVTNASQPDVLLYVLSAIGNSIHVRPVIPMDAELPFVSDEDAPGATAYRKQLSALLHDYPVQSLLHDRAIATIGDAGAQFHVLVLKTTLAIPYTSVFIRLDCKYWGADAEKRLRDKMAAAATSTQSPADSPNP